MEWGPYLNPAHILHHVRRPQEKRKREIVLMIDNAFQIIYVSMMDNALEIIYSTPQLEISG